MLVLQGRVVRASKEIFVNRLNPSKLVLRSRQGYVPVLEHALHGPKPKEGILIHHACIVPCCHLRTGIVKVGLGELEVR